jgi:hypothetical protein
MKGQQKPVRNEDNESDRVLESTLFDPIMLY